MSKIIQVKFDNNKIKNIACNNFHDLKSYVIDYFNIRHNHLWFLDNNNNIIDQYNFDSVINYTLLTLTFPP